MQSDQAADVEELLQPVLKVLGVESHQTDVIEHVRRRLAITFDAKAVHDLCVPSSTNASGDDYSKYSAYIRCSENRFGTLFPFSTADQNEARDLFRDW
jgi:hypothetical protein